MGETVARRVASQHHGSTVWSSVHCSFKYWEQGTEHGEEVNIVRIGGGRYTELHYGKLPVTAQPFGVLL